jgi:ribose transport system substrate-binding protein
VRTTLVSSGDDLNQQFNQIENFIASNVGMIVLNAADTKGIAPAVEKAKQAGIPIIAVDTAAEGGVDRANASKLYVNIIWYIGEELLSTYKTFN